MPGKTVRIAILAFLACLARGADAQDSPQQPQPAQAASSQASPQNVPSGQLHGAVRISLDQAIQLALENNHALKAARTTIQQSEAQEITANLRPNPVLTADAQFIPIFQPNEFTADYINTTAQFDLGISYLFERGKKRQHRLQAAQDVTAQTKSLVTDNERTLTFNVASQFFTAQLAESTLDLAFEDMKSFQKTVDISEARYKAGDISEVDYLKIKLQLLQFQSDVSQAQLAKTQALVGLRQLLGYQSVPEDFDVTGDFEYKAVALKLEDLQQMALQNRPDFRAAQQGVTAAKSQYELAKAIGKVDVTGTFNYDHVSATNTGSFFGSFQIPIFNRNQGEIARTNYAINQARELELAASDQVLSDVLTAYEGVRDNDQVVSLYLGGYLNAAQQSRDITEYSYKRGAASLLDFLDAERSYRATQLAYRQSLASYLTAVEQLREAVGTRSLP
ncbi:MAG TPA: TolC family protein [Candidatus Acidoferrales bacterium]|jgi:cobalt-zinc-cadmium efflux system outer membrane protein|nr:TolC family protein [Candidatus Acidoferrales bacterium]